MFEKLGFQMQLFGSDFQLYEFLTFGRLLTFRFSFSHFWRENSNIGKISGSNVTFWDDCQIYEFLVLQLTLDVYLLSCSIFNIFGAKIQMFDKLAK